MVLTLENKCSNIGGFDKCLNLTKGDRVQNGFGGWLLNGSGG